MNRKIYIAIALLGVSMLGVIAFQSYWLFENHKKAEANFKVDLFNSFSAAVDYEIDKRLENVFQIQKNEEIVYEVIERDGNKILKKSRIHQNNNKFIELETESVIIGEDVDTAKITWVPKGDRDNIDIKRRELDRVYVSIMSRMNSNQISGFDTEYFNEVFDMELKSRGINLDYDLALLSGDNYLIRNIHGDISKRDFSEFHNFPMRNMLFPGSKLAVVFPNKTMHLISRNAFLTISSFLLILISIISMIYIINRFFSQKRISEIRRDFMNNMTHELKTPISTVGLALEAMQDFNVLEDPKRTDQYIGIARKENHRLGMLVEKVLKMSSYERENIQLKWELIEADSFVNEVVKNLSFQVENSHAHIDINFEAGDSKIKVDKVHFTNVIYNLIDNALKYSGENPEIVVNSYIKDSKWILEVSDNGIGIPVNYQNKIFDKFFRVPSGNVHNVKGYGLGLSYVFNIINKFEGKIDLKSEENKGSTFRIELDIQESIN